ncbi:MAG TPA: MATE family efflux transporter [Gammaproteobacteria bacterium]|nr:MATE family efflux transporter [Gammaproteobacteria bacterium]
MPTQFSRSSLFSEIRTLLLLSLPIIANGLLESSGGFMNTFLVAHLGEKELAASALVTMLFVTLMVIFWGTISGVSIVIAHYHGAEDKPAIRGVVRDSILLSLIIAIPIMILLWFAPDIFKWTGQSDFIVHESKRYLHALVWAVPFDLPGFAIMQLFQGISKPRINFIFTMAYIPFLIWMNYLFMFGKFGLPALGLAGVGWSTTIAYALYTVAMALFIYYTPFYCDYADFRKASKKHFFGEILKIGLPLGVMYSCELGYFLVLAIFFGRMSQTILSAHQITIQYFWIAMTLVFAFSQAFSIRIGWRLGRKEPEWVLPITLMSTGVITLLSILIAILYWLFPVILINLDFIHAPKPDPALVNTAVLLFFYVALFQIVESVRLTLFAILRGLKDTRFTLYTSVLSFWGIALPVGYYLAFIRNQNYAQGLWIGLIFSAMVSIAILSFRLKYKIQAIKKGVE